MFDDQAGFDARLEWGDAGISRLAPISDSVVIVDVLRFSTAVDVAVERGALVFPLRWRDERAAAFARQIDAVLASGHGDASPAVPYSLSPVSLAAIAPGTRLALPSPNGATLSLLAADHGATVFAGCLRNATAVATACRAAGGTVAVIAAGERWRDAGDATASLRVALEDLIGAGAILSALSPANPSPEAMAAIAVFAAAKETLPAFLARCASGQELTGWGLTGDVEMAAALDASRAAPRLVDGAFVADGLPGS